MGYWGWRRLALVFILVWIVGCTDIQENPPTNTPTELPPITLTVRISGRTATSTPPGLPVVTTIERASTPGGRETETQPDISPAKQTPAIRTPTPLPLELPEPTCYETTTTGVLCLGRVDNTQPEAVERVSVQVEIYQADGTLLRTQETTVAQQVIWAGESAPYRVLFPTEKDDALPDAFGAVIAKLLRAERIPPGDDRFMELQLEEQQGWQVDDQYVVTGRLSNPGPENTKDVRVTVTLFDDGGRVAGYRTEEVAAVKAGESAAFQMEIISQITGGPLHHALHIEAKREK